MIFLSASRRADELLLRPPSEAQLALSTADLGRLRQRLARRLLQTCKAGEERRKAKQNRIHLACCWEPPSISIYGSLMLNKRRFSPQHCITHGEVPLLYANNGNSILSLYFRLLLYIFRHRLIFPLYQQMWLMRLREQYKPK
jgi:hypothetical protein